MAEFTLEGARALLPQILQLTEEAIQRAQSLSPDTTAPEISAAEEEAAQEELIEVVRTWTSQIIELGALPKGLWLVDFDSGDGYWCWKYPESSIEFWHGYQDGFAGRELIAPHILH